MNKEGITVAGNLIADVVYTIDVYPQKGNLTWMRNPVAHTGGINNLIIDFTGFYGEVQMIYRQMVTITFGKILYFYQISFLLLNSIC